MAAIQLTRGGVSALKAVIRKQFPDVRSSHLTEALAAAMGRRSHAAVLAEVDQVPEQDAPFVLLDMNQFNVRLQAFGYPPEEEFDFEWEAARDGPIVSTAPPSTYDIEFKSARDKAWRSLMVATINAGLVQRLFSLRPDDNRWPGATPPDSHERDDGWLFDFKLPGDMPVRGYVGNAGFGELSIHAAVYPKDNDWVRTSNGGFDAGDAFATGWLERRNGFWLQHSPEFFNCRRPLVPVLANIQVAPLGYGDRGRVIM
jgi:hypothetical protein